MNDVPPLLEKATDRHRAGDLSAARKLYLQFLDEAPDHAVGRFRLGLLDLQEGHFDSALELIQQAAATSPGQANFQTGLGQIFSALQRWTDAAAAYHCAIALQPDSPDSYFSLGCALQSAGDLKGALAAFEQTLLLQSDHAQALSNLGIVLLTLGRVDEAIKLLSNAAALQPGVARHAVNLGAALCAARRFSEAVEVLRDVAEPTHSDADAAFNLGNALHGLGRLTEALEQYHRAVTLRPAYAEAWNNIGNVQKQLGKFVLAAEAYESAIAAGPGFVPAINNLGCLLRSIGRLEEAEMTLRRGLAADHDHPALHENLASVLKDSGELDEAIKHFRLAVALEPGNAATHSSLVYSLSFSATEAAPILEECLRWNHKHASALSSGISVHLNDRSPRRRLKIGYVSPDFRDHCLTLFSVPLLSHHDHHGFEIFCYSSVERPDLFTRRLNGYADHWRDVPTMSDAALCDLIRRDRIDILVDLTMHMGNGRPLVFARKPAPVQIAWLAYPGTTGISAMDYRLSDPRLDMPDSISHYSEQTLYLPDSFWCYDPLTDQPEVNALPALSKGAITFGCLNNPCKLSDRTLGLWRRILSEVAGSRMILMAPPGPRRLRLHEGLGDRVEFVSFKPRAEYLRTYHDIDVGLDTFPYNGHTTSLDSLWMGVPVVTRVGQTCVGRAGLSQLFQLDLTELAATSDEAFVATAVALAGDLPQLARLRQQLRGRLMRSPLMDGPRFARNMEAVYRKAWEKYCLAPEYSNTFSSKPSRQ